MTESRTYLDYLADSGHLASSCVPYFFNELRGAQSSSLPPYCFPSNCPELATTGSSEPWGSLICCSPPRCRRNCIHSSSRWFRSFLGDERGFVCTEEDGSSHVFCVCVRTRVCTGTCVQVQRGHRAYRRFVNNCLPPLRRPPILRGMDEQCTMFFLFSPLKLSLEVSRMF